MRFIHLFTLTFGLLLSTNSFADILPSPQKVSAHCYAWIGPYGPPTKENKGFRMNLGFVVGRDAVAVIDSGYSGDMAKEMLKQIKQVTRLPVRYVINTNSQPHRILGNSVFKKDGAKIFAGKDAVTRMVKDGATMASSAEKILALKSGSIHEPGIADIVIEKTTELDLGGITLKVINVGKAHTPGSLIIEVAKENVIYTGDVLYSGRLLGILPSLSRVDAWIDAYNLLRSFTDAKFVPGHGNPGKLADFEHSTFKYLTSIKNHMDKAVDDGDDLQDAINKFDQSKWKSLSDFEALARRNAHTTYMEREAASFE